MVPWRALAHATACPNPPRRIGADSRRISLLLLFLANCSGECTPTCGLRSGRRAAWSWARLTGRASQKAVANVLDSKKGME